MSRLLSIRNRQQVCRIDLPLLRCLTQRLLDHHLGVPTFELGLHLVGSMEMARVNEHFLQHSGSTDVLSFDHRAPANPAAPALPGSEPVLHGELFLSLDDALAQARLFRTSWQAELVRYIVHGLLHFRGHDDRTPAARRRMKRVENRLLHALAREFRLEAIGKRAAPRPRTAP